MLNIKDFFDLLLKRLQIMIIYVTVSIFYQFNFTGLARIFNLPDFIAQFKIHNFIISLFFI